MNRAASGRRRRITVINDQDDFLELSLEAVEEIVSRGLAGGYATPVSHMNAGAASWRCGARGARWHGHEEAPTDASLRRRGVR